MALYGASGNPLSVEQLRALQAQLSSGDENTPPVFTDTQGYSGDGNRINPGGASSQYGDVLSQALRDAGFTATTGALGTGLTDNGYLALDDPSKLAQAQQLGVVQYQGGVPVANYNDPNLRGGEGSGALFADMPQENMLKTIAPALIGAGLGVAGGLAGLGGVADAGVVSGGGVGGGAGGAISGGGVGGGAGGVVDGGLLNYSMNGTLGGGLGTAAAGGAADAAALGGGAVGASSVAPYSLASGVGGGLGGSATLGAGGASLYSLGSGLGGGISNSLGSAAGSAAAGAGATALGPSSGGDGTTFGIPNNVLSGLATGVGGLLAANETGDAYRDVANQYLALGQPYRDRLNASYQPGFSLAQADPAFQNALDVAGQTSARALSTKYGNPADSPTAQAEMQKYLLGNVELPQLNTYRSQLGSFGNLGVNTAGTGSLAGANTTGQGYEAIGAGLGQALNPQPSLADLFKQFGTGSSNKSTLSIGGLPYGG